MWKRNSKSRFGIASVKDGTKTRGSKLEKSVAGIIALRVKAGEIELIREQQHIHWYFEEAVKLGEYWPDFTARDCKTQEIFWIEAKGDYPNPIWPRNLKLWAAGGPGRLEIWKGNWKNPCLDSIVIPYKFNGLIKKEQVYGKLV